MTLLLLQNEFVKEESNVGHITVVMFDGKD